MSEQQAVDADTTSLGREPKVIKRYANRKLYDTVESRYVTLEEIAEMILFTASFSPAYSGAARRIPIPGTEIARRGTISELRMAQIVAITRLGMPRTVLGNCTHEPCTLGGLAGANLFWAEVGANPRDTKERTEEGRGETVLSCRDIFNESGWDIWEGPSRYYNRMENRNGV